MATFGLAEKKIRVWDAENISTQTWHVHREERDVHRRYLSLPRDCQSCWSVLVPPLPHLFLEDQVGRRQSETRSCVSSKVSWKTVLLILACEVWKIPGYPRVTLSLAHKRHQNWLSSSKNPKLPWWAFVLPGTVYMFPLNTINLHSMWLLKITYLSHLS